LYWFDAAVTSSASLLKLAEDSRECLGERFTPEYHVELPIAKSFSCIGCDGNWRSSIRTILSDVYDLTREIKPVKKYSLLKAVSEIIVGVKHKEPRPRIHSTLENRHPMFSWNDWLIPTVIVLIVYDSQD